LPRAQAEDFDRAAAGEGWPNSLGREKFSELFLFSADFGKTALKRPMIRGDSRKIPYAAEQGTNSAIRE
jgi:hypothetical protein